MVANNVDLSNGRSWKSQKAATEHYRAIRDRYADRAPIDDASDHDDLAALLERYDTAHTDEDTKIGSGIDYFEVRTNFGSGGPTRGFWVTRKDGTSTDFSFPWAIRGIPKPQAQETGFLKLATTPSKRARTLGKPAAPRRWMMLRRRQSVFRAATFLANEHWPELARRYCRRSIMS
jgi:hypothetical protein